MHEPKSLVCMTVSFFDVELVLVFSSIYNQAYVSQICIFPIDTGWYGYCFCMFLSGRAKKLGRYNCTCMYLYYKDVPVCISDMGVKGLAGSLGVDAELRWQDLEAVEQLLVLHREEVQPNQSGNRIIRVAGFQNEKKRIKTGHGSKYT